MDKFTYKIAENKEELGGSLELREKVFDTLEKEAVHVVVKDGKRIVGTARIRFLSPRQAKLERMAVLKSLRNMDIGKRMISFLVEELKNRQIEKIILHAQHEAVEFYKRCGFKESSSPFWEADIEHTKMERTL